MNTSTDAVRVRELIPRSSLGEGAVESPEAGTMEAQIIRIRRGLRVREFVDPAIRLSFDALARRTIEIYQEFQADLDEKYKRLERKIQEIQMELE